KHIHNNTNKLSDENAELAATAIASWHRNGAEVPEPNVQAAQSPKGCAEIKAGAAYLPDRFVDEERAAPIEPLPPQF
ncbi:MAG: hypothetical protein ACJ8GO_19540, partial [Ramlibacter sp.]